MILLVGLLWLLGALLVRKNKVLLGYTIIIAGWALSIAAEVMFSTAWDRGFGAALVGLVFLWLVQKTVAPVPSRAAAKKR